MCRMPTVSTSFNEGNEKDGIKMKWKIILWVCLPWHLRQSVLFSPHLLNFGSYTNGVHTNWDNLKWRCLRNHSCDDCQTCVQQWGLQEGERYTTGIPQLPYANYLCWGAGNSQGDVQPIAGSVGRGLPELQQKSGFGGWSMSAYMLLEKPHWTRL